MSILKELGSNKEQLRELISEIGLCPDKIKLGKCYGHGEVILYAQPVEIKLKKEVGKSNSITLLVIYSEGYNNQFGYSKLNEVVDILEFDVSVRYGCRTLPFARDEENYPVDEIFYILRNILQEELFK